MNFTSLEDRIEKNSATHAHTEAEFREVFNRMYQKRFDSIGEPFSGMNPSEVLRLVDPIVYQIALNGWAIQNDYVLVRGKFYPRECVEIDVEEEIKALRWKIEWLKQRSKPDDEDVTACLVANVRGQIEAVKNYLPKVETT